MQLIKKTIAEGITLNVIPTDKFKTDRISVNFLTPLDPEKAALNALLVKVLSRGTKSWPDLKSLSRALDDIYSTNLSDYNYKRGETQIFGFSLDMLKSEYAVDETDIMSEALKILSEVLFSPALENGGLRTDYVEAEKKNLIDDIKAKINNKSGWALERCVEEMCAGERYSVSVTGTIEQVEKIKPEDLTKHYKNIFRNCRIEIFYVGDADIDRIYGLVKNLMAPLSDGVKAPALSADVKRKAENEPKEITENILAKQGKLVLGFRSGSVLEDPDYHMFKIFCELYGGSPTCKLFENVRERLSLCYYCWASKEAFKGIMLVSSGIENTDKDKAQDEILRQLRLVAEGDFTDEELENAKRSLCNGYKGIYDRRGSLEAWYLGRLLAGRDEDSPLKNVDKIMKVTREEVMQKAAGVSLDTVYFMYGTEEADAAEEGEEEDVSD
jgi:predicted Zn-dependent peptidase